MAMARGPMPGMMNPPIVLLKEGTDTSQGKGQLLSNIGACTAVVDTIRTTLGPRGMDKLIAQKNGTVTISNDGATILKLLDIVHPAAKSLVDIARAQDAEVGDGTTSVVLFAGELLREVKSLIEDGVSAQTIVSGLRRASVLAVGKVREEAQQLSDLTGSGNDLQSMLTRCASTAMSSKLIRPHEEFFTKMVVDAVMMLGQEDSLNESLIGMKKVAGGGLEDSQLVDGVAFKKTFSYAGFEQQPKRFENPKILLLNVELELKAEKDNAEVRVDTVNEYQAIVDAEWNIIYDKLDKIVETGAKVVLSRLPIGDLATQYFADRDIFCAGRVTMDDLKRTVTAVGGIVQSSVNDLKDEYLGTCKLFEEVQIGNERWNLFTGCPKSKSCTLILRGGAEQFTDEVERSLHDAIMIVRRALKCKDVVAGGGAIEMELSRFIRDHARTIHGKQQTIMTHFARALEIIPRQLCDNAGFDSTDVLNKLRQRHATEDKSGRFIGIDMKKEGLDEAPIGNNLENFVWEPSVIKVNMLSAATEAACLVLSIDETVKNTASEKPQSGLPGPSRGRRGGIPRR